jgi:hypothetical protein
VTLAEDDTDADVLAKVADAINVAFESAAEREIHAAHCRFTAASC